jgi:DNA-binding transcriptional ArsR family regulator
MLAPNGLMVQINEPLTGEFVMADLQQLRQQFAQNSQLLTALGDANRQAIIMVLLADQVCSGKRVPELTSATGLSRPAVSHHLKILRAVGLVQYRREGTMNYYYLTHDTAVIKQLQMLLDNVENAMEAHTK